MEDKLSERCIEGSEIFLIWAGMPIMMNSVFEGLRRRRLDDTTAWTPLLVILIK